MLMNLLRQEPQETVKQIIVLIMNKSVLTAIAWLKDDKESNLIPTYARWFSKFFAPLDKTRFNQLKYSIRHGSQFFMTNHQYKEK